jgi:hypothetical protein
MSTQQLDIVHLIEHNPITKLSQDYNDKLLTRVKETFTESQQQLFVSSFYCYLNYNQYTDYVVDLDNVWQWLGFSQKAMAKRSLEKYFIIERDYKISLCRSAEQSNETKGGHNKETILLNINTFKLFCLKAGTSKANEIHSYYVKLEGMLHEVIQERCEELMLQLETQKEMSENELESLREKTTKDLELLREKTILEQFQNNTQCVYYGSIDNTTENCEKLVKYGNSNNLRERVDQHKRNFTNFRLVNAFKVENKLHIENCIKQNDKLKPYKRTIEIHGVNCTELLAIDDLSFTSLDKIIKDIITNIEYSPENYLKILQLNKELSEEITNFKKENASLKEEYKTFKTIFKKVSQENNKLKIELDKILKNENEPRVKLRKYIKQTNGNYYIDGIEYKLLNGTRQEVWDGIAYRTSGNLIKNDFIINRVGKIVSKTKSDDSTNNPRSICQEKHISNTS